MELCLDMERTLDIPVKDAVITTRLLATDELIKMRDKHTKMVNTRSGPSERFDRVAYSKDFWDRTIISWTGLTNNGAEIECTRENKYALVSRFDEIAVEINTAIELAKQQTIEAEAADLKN